MYDDPVRYSEVTMGSQTPTRRVCKDRVGWGHSGSSVCVRKLIVWEMVAVYLSSLPTCGLLEGVSATSEMVRESISVCAGGKLNREEVEYGSAGVVEVSLGILMRTIYDWWLWSCEGG